MSGTMMRHLHLRAVPLRLSTSCPGVFPQRLIFSFRSHSHSRFPEGRRHHLSVLGSTPSTFAPRRGFSTDLDNSFADVPATTLDAFRKCSTQSLVDALWVMGWPNAMCDGPQRLASAGSTSKSGGKTCAGQAVTLRFVPHRPDIAADKPSGSDSPEYAAFSRCSQGRVLVASSVAPSSNSIGGDIKFLALRQNGVEGIVTDGSVRDLNVMGDYGFDVFAAGKTARQGPAFMQPWGVNEVVEVGGVSVRPGDIVVGDDDGVVVVPLSVHEDVLKIAQERENVEDVIKETVVNEGRCPSEFYPFRPPVTRDSALGRLLAEKLPGSKMLARKFSSRPHFSPMPRASLAQFSTTSSSNTSIPETMRAVVVPETGPASVMELRNDLQVPSSLSDGQCLVRNEYAGLNFIDTYHRGGLYPRDLPFIAGQEAGGFIVASTPSAEAAGYAVGDRVAYSTLGTYAEYSAVDSAKLLPVPSGLGTPEATACVVQGLTAHYLTTDAHAGLIQPGQWMLIHAAAGGTGQVRGILATHLLIQYATHPTSMHL